MISQLKDVISGNKGTTAIIVLGVVLLVLAFLISIAKWLLIIVGLVLMVIGGVRVYTSIKAKTIEKKVDEKK